MWGLTTGQLWVLGLIGGFIILPMIVYLLINMGAKGFYKARQDYINDMVKGESTDEHARQSQEKSARE